MSDVTATTTTATTLAAPAPPAAPLSPAEAAERLVALRSDTSWGERVLKGDPAALAEMRNLAKQVAEGSDLDAFIVAAADQPDTNVNGQLSAKKVAGEITSLREHLSDGVIREILEGRVPSTEEISATRKFKAMRHGDPKWVDAYLKGSFEETRESKLISSILMMAPS
jgi:hypothetical protein